MWRGRTTRTVAGVSDDQAVDEIENHPHAPPPVDSTIAHAVAWGLPVEYLYRSARPDEAIRPASVLQVLPKNRSRASNGISSISAVG